MKYDYTKKFSEKDLEYYFQLDKYGFPIEQELEDADEFVEVMPKQTTLFQKENQKEKIKIVYEVKFNATRFNVSSFFVSPIINGVKSEGCGVSSIPFSSWKQTIEQDKKFQQKDLRPDADIEFEVVLIGTNAYRNLDDKEQKKYFDWTRDYFDEKLNLNYEEQKADIPNDLPNDIPNDLPNDLDEDSFEDKQEEEQEDEEDEKETEVKQEVQANLYSQEQAKDLKAKLNAEEEYLNNIYWIKYIQETINEIDSGVIFDNNQRDGICREFDVNSADEESLGITAEEYENLSFEELTKKSLEKTLEFYENDLLLDLSQADNYSYEDLEKRRKEIEAELEKIKEQTKQKQFRKKKAVVVEQAIQQKLF